MNILDQKHRIILEYEKSFADFLALQVLDRPRLSVWMILIPVIFVHYFYRIQKFNVGRNAFAENYLSVRRRALDGAVQIIRTGKSPDIEWLAGQSKLPQAVYEPNKEMLDFLLMHYADLMRSDGDSFESLVRSNYKTRSNYLLALNQMNRLEKTLNAALTPHLENSMEGVHEIIRAMEIHSERLRRKHAELVFP